ncbi:MAG TPA: hypothetical protein VGM93_06270, partial [Acidimicrobiales bacterium]
MGDVRDDGLIRRRATFGATLVVAIAPALLSTWRAHVQHWIPVADNALLAVSAVDATRGHPPLLGAESSSLEVLTKITPVHHLGPFEAYLLALAHLFGHGPTPLLLAILLVNVASIVAVLLAARALGGTAGLLGAGLVVVSLGAALGVQVLGDIWNPYAPLFPLLAALLTLWAYLGVRWRPGLPIGLLAISWCVQAHLTHLPILVAAAVPPLAFVIWDRRRARSAEVETPTSEDAGEPVEPAIAQSRWRGVAGRVGRWVRTRPLTAASAAVAGLVWLPPILAELGGGPSNVSNLVRATLHGTHERPLGLGYAINTTARVLGGPPPFGPRPNVRAIWVVPLGVELTSAAWVAAIAIGCGAAIVVGRRRGDAALTAIGSSLLGAMAMGLYLLERSTFSSGAAIYQTRWLWVLVAAAWLGLGLVAARLLGPVAHRLRPPGRWLAAGLGVAVIGVAAIARLGFAGGPTERIGPSLANEQRSTREVVAGIERR